MLQDGLTALGVGGVIAVSSLFAQSSGPPDAVSWMSQLGPAAGAAVVAWVAFMYVRKRDEDAAKRDERQEATANRFSAAIDHLQDRQEAQGKENREALKEVVNRMESMVRENARTHNDGLAQLTQAVQLVVGTVTAFQRSQDEALSETQNLKANVNLLAQIVGVEHATDEPSPQFTSEAVGREPPDSKTKTPRGLKGGGTRPCPRVASPGEDEVR